MQNIASINQETQLNSKRKLHFKYLDGLRGLAALYVLFVHIDPVLNPEIATQFPLWFSLFLKFLRNGAFSVVIFITLSGYGLMLSIARSQSGFIKGGILGYLKRRSWRILPSYYISLGVCLLMAVGVFLLERFSEFRWDKVAAGVQFNPHFSLWDLSTHLLLIHNLSLDTYRAINPPLWSIGSEWQLYFIFPFLLLPIWRKWGIKLTVVTGFIIGLIPVYLFNDAFSSAAPWFIGIFALGMAAADIGFSQEPNVIKLRQTLPWKTLALVFTILALITEWRPLGLHLWIGETFLGLACTCLFISCTEQVLQNQPLPRILQIFEHPWIVALGGFSYSLYLIHGPIVTVVRYILVNLNLPPLTFAIAFFLIATFSSLIISYLFFLAFERPFISNLTNK